ncbi:hypothetical protein PCASD_10407 [Puccinia coronata f. sp. avenae]|uniref:Uncharacterized protein n=1 Tax=Puccinia coronata f. sp. avenae TaxID=200324 RepID=A0A2N5URN7_9BASI|nr:hypothetical protein PCASD_10407 [Puccinia coronata f. sp. avenae]
MYPQTISSTSALLLELNALGSSDGLLGGLKHTLETFAITAGLDNDVTGCNSCGSLVSTDGLLNVSTLKKQLSLPKFDQLESSVNETGTETQSTASGLGSKLSGLQRKHYSFAEFRKFDLALMKIPFIGYIPGISTLTPIPSLPIILSFPGISLRAPPLWFYIFCVGMGLHL